MKRIKFTLLFALMFSIVTACSNTSTESSQKTNEPSSVHSKKKNVSVPKVATKESDKTSNTPEPKKETNNTSVPKSEAKPTSPTTKPTSSVRSQVQPLASLDFKGQQVVVINNNKTTFSKSDLSLSRGTWQSFSNLDSLNRVGVANAMLSKSLMPKVEREPLYVDPTGWKNKKITVNGKTEWLYNRSHLIGYQLTGENNNLKNLMTGTRSLNDPDMVIYENKVASYLKSTNHHIRYQVEPVFRGNELLARGVHMQGKSIEDNAVEFNVYIFNVEDGVTINYADGSSTVRSGGTSSTTPPANKGTNGTSGSVSITTSNLTVSPGDHASVSIKTKPNTKGTIEVDYASGPSHAAGLEPKTSDKSGNIGWSWEVGTRTKPGTYNVIIRVNGQTITKHLVVK